MKIQLNTLPEPVRNFILALQKNAQEVEGWDKDFVNTLLHVKVGEDGVVTVCDNYEKFFEYIYTYNPSNDSWKIRFMYSDIQPRDYTYNNVMHDASVMYTG